MGFRLCMVYCISFFAVSTLSDCFFDGKTFLCSSNLEKIQLSDMASLDLSYHNLTDLPSDILSLNAHITVLNLTSNLLRRMEERRPLSQLQQLEVLDLTYNSLIFMNLNIFSKNPKLRILILNDNPHMLLSPSTAKLPNLQELHLENCGLHKLHSTTFQQLNELKMLNLQWNLFMQLPESLSSVDVILLKGNPMVADDRDKAGNAKNTYRFGWMGKYTDLRVVQLGFLMIGLFCSILYYLYNHA